MSGIVRRHDQIAIIVCNPIRHVRHYTQEEIKGVIVNFSSDDLYLGAISWGNVRGGHVNRNIPKVFPAHSSTGEIVLLTLDINRDDIDPVENMVVGRFGFQYSDASGTRYATESGVFQLLLQ